MKRLYLVRHAKSSWSNPELRDFDRPLNKRGNRDAPFMGSLLKEKGIRPDLLITSPAKRTLVTAEYFADELNYPKEDIVKEDDLYEAGARNILKIVSEQEEKISSIMLFGHNPGLTDFCNIISDRQVDNIPTSAVVLLILNAERWNELDEDTCKLEFFEYPKKYFT